MHAYLYSVPPCMWKAIYEWKICLETCSSSKYCPFSFAYITGYPCCLVHVVIRSLTGSPVSSSRTAHRSSVLAFEYAYFFMYEAKAFWKSKDFWKLKLEQAENYIVGNRARWRKNHKCNRNSHIFNCTKHQSSSYYGTVKSNNYNHLWYFWFQIPYVKTQCIRVAAETSCIACLRMKKKTIHTRVQKWWYTIAACQSSQRWK